MSTETGDGATEVKAAGTGRPNLGADRERRLHPLSWLFVLLMQLRSFAVPLIALLVLGDNENSWQWWGLVGVGALTLAAVLRYFTWRFRIEADELVIRSGVLQRTVRHMPLARIQSVSLHRNLLHRLLDVAEVRLESSAGGEDPEARMQVLSMADARALEQLVEWHRNAPAAGEPAPLADRAPTLPAATPLLHLSALEVLKLGLISGRSPVVLALAAGAIGNVVGDEVWDGLVAWFTQTGEHYGAAGDTSLVWTVLSLAVLMAVIVLGRVLGIVLAFVRDFDFRLEHSGVRLSVERGLLTRLRASVPISRIQHWTLRQSWLMRRLQRRSVTVETATSPGEHKEAVISALVPLATPEHVDAIVRTCVPTWPLAIPFQPLHPRAWRRMCVVPCLMTLAICAGLALKLGVVAGLGLVLLPIWVLVARQQARAAGFALTEDLLIWRSGWINRRVSFAQIDRLQGLRQVQSPFDRRHGMATLLADTAGAHALGHRLHLVYLPEAQARAVFATLAGRMADTEWSC